MKQNIQNIQNSIDHESNITTMRVSVLESFADEYNMKAMKTKTETHTKATVRTRRRIRTVRIRNTTHTDEHKQSSKMINDDGRARRRRSLRR